MPMSLRNAHIYIKVSLSETLNGNSSWLNTLKLKVPI